MKTTFFTIFTILIVFLRVFYVIYVKISFHVIVPLSGSQDKTDLHIPTELNLYPDIWVDQEPQSATTWESVNTGKLLSLVNKEN